MKWLWALDSNSMKGKVALNLLDKVVLGIIVVLATAYVQWQSKKIEQERSYSISIANLNSGLILDHIKELNREYVQIERTIETYVRSSGITDAEVSAFRISIGGIVERIGVIEALSGGTAGETREQMKTAAGRLLKMMIDKGDRLAVEAGAHELRKQFFETVRKMRDRAQVTFRKNVLEL